MNLKHINIALALLSGLGFSSAPVFAQVTRTWVSGVGDDANPCSRTAPCKTFAGAISRTVAGGEINCIDAGGFGVLMITKSISIACATGEAGVLASGTDGIIINAGLADVVMLSGLDIEGMGIGLNGITVESAADVVIKNCSIHRFSGDGVAVVSNTLARVIIRSSTIGENGDAGVMVNSAPGFGRVRILDSMVLGNGADGVRVNGTGNQVILSNDEIMASTRQLNVSTGVSGGTIYSLGNNFITTSNGDDPTAMTLK